MIESNKLKKFRDIKHGFFNRKGGVSKGIYKSLNCGIGSNDNKKNVLKNLKIVSKNLGFKIENLILLKQIHSNKIYYIKKAIYSKLSGDGILTNKSNIALGILTADCAPVFFYDPKKKIIAAAHVGWKGAYKKIVKKIINFYLNNGSNMNDLQIVIGPCIVQKNYEVGIEFKNRFIKQNKKNIKYFKNIKNRIFFSLNDYIKGQLIDLKVKNIEIIKKDTYNGKNNFFSSRRSKKKNHDYGRNISLIMIK